MTMAFFEGNYKSEIHKFRNSEGNYDFSFGSQHLYKRSARVSRSLVLKVRGQLWDYGLLPLLVICLGRYVLVYLVVVLIGVTFHLPVFFVAVRQSLADICRAARAA